MVDQHLRLTVARTLCQLYISSAVSCTLRKLPIFDWFGEIVHASHPEERDLNMKNVCFPSTKCFWWRPTIQTLPQAAPANKFKRTPLVQSQALLSFHARRDVGLDPFGSFRPRSRGSNGEGPSLRAFGAFGRNICMQTSETPNGLRNRNHIHGQNQAPTREISTGRMRKQEEPCTNDWLPGGFH